MCRTLQFLKRATHYNYYTTCTCTYITHGIPKKVCEKEWKNSLFVTWHLVHFACTQWLWKFTQTSGITSSMVHSGQWTPFAMRIYTSTSAQCTCTFIRVYFFNHTHIWGRTWVEESTWTDWQSRALAPPEMHTRCVFVYVCVLFVHDVGNDSPALFACKALSMEVSLFGTVDILPTVSHPVLIKGLVVS